MAKVQVQEGILVGRECKTAEGFKYYEFLQVPYAEPPLGDLRFKTPQPPKSWTGERDATTVSVDNTSNQRDDYGNVSGTEDCLYLNVFTPKLRSEKLLPVIVHIHGGGFVRSNGTIKETSGPNYLLEQNIVVVSINYRLGVLGFLSLDIPEAAGNMGLKDQVAALKWVQENISVFGGDKTNVTLFGFSAGSASVEYHMLSKASTGLFSKGILHSGSVLNHWAIQYNIKEFSLKVAQNLGYQGSITNIPAVHEYLMKQPMLALEQEASNLAPEYVLDGIINFIFVPSIEQDFGNNEAFLTQRPYELLKEGKFNKIPIIRGFTEYEGSLAQCICPNSVIRLQKEKVFTDFIKYSFNSQEIEKYNKDFRQRYLHENANDDDDKWAAVNYFSDYDFNSGIIKSSKMLADHGVPVYSYVFRYFGNISLLKFMFQIDRKGPGHVDDIVYLIDHAIPGFDNNFTEEDQLLKKRMVKMWTDFAKTGNPTTYTSEDIPVLWPTFTKEQLNYLVIDKDLLLEIGYQTDRIDLFEKLYEKYYE